MAVVGEQGQLATYKEMAAAAEEDRGRLEAEVVATAQLATAVEARLRSALTAKDAAESRVAAAELRAHQACDCPLPASGNVIKAIADCLICIRIVHQKSQGGYISTTFLTPLPMVCNPGHQTGDGDCRNMFST